MDLGADNLGDVVEGVAFDANGNVLVAASTGTKAVVARLNSDGDLDDTFAGDGVFEFPDASPSHALDVKVHHFGTILVAGDLTLPGPPVDQQGLLFRLRPNGTLDPTFGGGDGWAIAGYDNRTDGLTSVSSGSNSIAVAGTSSGVADGDHEMFVARFTDRSASSVTVGVRKTRTKTIFKGKVAPNHSGQKVRVSYFRKKAGKWRLIARKSPTLNASSAYSASFRRSKATRCRVLAEFAADLDHLAGSKHAVFRC
jgi:hypothetical protein